MTLWLIRAGSRGEHEQKFLDEGKVYVAWDGLNVDLKALSDRQALIQAMEQRYPDEKPKALINWSSQVWSFGCYSDLAWPLTMWQALEDKLLLICFCVVNRRSQLLCIPKS